MCRANNALIDTLEFKGISFQLFPESYILKPTPLHMIIILVPVSWDTPTILVVPYLIDDYGRSTGLAPFTSTILIYPL
jgi:hypothetical protein